MADFKKDDYYNYFVNGEKVPLKLNKTDKKVYVHPLLVRDYIIYEKGIEVLTLNKNRINDIEIIQMSYLNFLICLFVDNKDMLEDFTLLMQKCLNCKNLSINEDNGRIVLVLCDDKHNVVSVINEREFDELRHIILYQNNADYRELQLSEEVEQLYVDYIGLISQDTHVPTLEEKKSFLMYKSDMTLEQVNNLPIRYFEQMVSIAVKEMEFIGNKIIQGSYKYEVKEDIMHPLYIEKQDPLSKLFFNKDDFVNKLKKSGAKVEN